MSSSHASQRLPNEALAELCSFLPFRALQTKALLNRQLYGIVSNHAKGVLERAGTGDNYADFMQHLFTTTLHRYRSAKWELLGKQRMLERTWEEQGAVHSNLEALSKLPIFRTINTEGYFNRLHTATTRARQLEEECRVHGEAYRRLAREMEAVEEWWVGEWRRIKNAQS